MLVVCWCVTGGILVVYWWCAVVYFMIASCFQLSVVILSDIIAW